VRDEADRFLEFASENSELWNSIEVRTLAVKVGRRWAPLMTRAYLDPRPPEQVPALGTVPRDRLSAWQAVAPSSQLESVVEGWVAGKIPLKPRTLWVFGEEDSTGRHSLSSFFDDRGSPSRVHRTGGWSAYTLIGYGPSVHDLVRDAGLSPQSLDNMIRGGPTPYDGYAGLADRFIGTTAPVGYLSSSSVFEIVAPIGVRFERRGTRKTIAGLKVTLQASAMVYVAAPQLHWIALGPESTPIHGSISVAELDWAEDEAEGYRAEFEIAAEGAAELETIFLQHHGYCVDRLATSAGEPRNPRLLAADATVLDGLFPTEWNRANEFERAVGFLLFGLGFQVNSIAMRQKGGGALDLVAHDPYSDTILAVECTVGALETGKAGKLVARASQLQSAIPKASLMPVLISARSTDELSASERAKAQRDGVYLLTREGLARLQEIARSGGSTSDALALLLDTQSKFGADGTSAPGRFGVDEVS
jgi:hypothetical protein